MTETLQAAGTVCGALIAAELVSKLCPQDRMLGFVRGLTALMLIASLCMSIAGLEWDWAIDPEGAVENTGLTEYVEDRYAAAAREDMEGYIRGLLGSAGIEAKKIRADIHITEDGSISCTKASLTIAYESEARRARALLSGALAGVPVEVTVDGA